MVTEGHKCGRREDFPQKRKEEIDKELSEILSRDGEASIEDAT
jgi:hypothetical protein